MIRRIIEINEDKCNGCGSCAEACHEGAIGIIEGKARLLRDDYCDGLGDCLPTCPTGAISFVEREADAYDEEAVKKNMEKRLKIKPDAEHKGCPGNRVTALNRNETLIESGEFCYKPQSRLSSWPVQIKLAPVNSPNYLGAKLLIAADCTAYAYAAFHEDFMKGHVTLIGCPKLDSTDYSQKLGEIIKNNEIKSVKLVRMEVPCCGGLELAVKKALQQSGKFIPWQVVTISLSGKILD
jgi:NAD-dependent dihydropyrimidine dehydrogenase PreA subunit